MGKIRQTMVAIAVLSIGLWANEANTTQPQPFSVPLQKVAPKKTALVDPAYGITFQKDSPFTCRAKLANGDEVYFASVKSMLQAYFHPDYFTRHKLIADTIATMYVRDYLNGKELEATQAVYVFGSRLVGPHGDDLIPLSGPEQAKLFELKYGGHKILPFERLTKGLIRYLDM
jgi:nitrous oxide reductase accessory protein NosL